MSFPQSLGSPEPAFAAFIGLDWGDRKHYWKLAVAGSDQVAAGEVLNTPEALQAWVAELQCRFAGQPLAVALEQRRGAVVYQLGKFPLLVLYAVHPTTACKYRQAFFPSGSKKDPVDADLLLELVLRHRDRLRRIDPEAPETRLLQWLVEHRRKLVDERTRHSNRLTANLKIYYPQALLWFDNIDAPISCAFLQRWPTLQDAQHAHPGTLRKFFVQHNCRSSTRMQQRLDGIYPAIAAVVDRALLTGCVAITTSLIALLKTLNEQIDILDDQLKTATAAHPDAELFAGLPGAGAVLRPRLLAALGTDRDRFGSAQELQNYAGISPVRSQSGKTQCVSCRRACPKFLQQTFQEFAACSIRSCAWARAFYESEMAIHHQHYRAIRKLAFKWIRILFACWRDRKPYQEEIYTQSLLRRNSPLAKALSATATPTDTKPTWVAVAGFQKLVEENS
jgi:transposase